MPDKALVIKDDKGKFKDVGDVLAVARSEGKKLFKTREGVLVVRMFYDGEVGWIVVVRYPSTHTGCSNTLVVSEGAKELKMELNEKVGWKAEWIINKFKDSSGEIEKMLKLGAKVEDVIKQFPEAFIGTEVLEDNVGLNVGYNI